MNLFNFNIKLPFGFQDPASPIMEGIIDLHNHIFLFDVVIFVFVLVMFSFIIKQFYFDVHFPNSAEDISLRHLFVKSRNVVHGTALEIVWTITPSIILAFIAMPSFALLYAMDEMIDPTLTIKVIGRQWYWVYEYSDFNTYDAPSIAYESYMVPEGDLKFGDFRLLEVDAPVFLPTNTHIRVIVTAGDVLHSWAVPSLGIKTDAVPGRLNQASLFIKREGVYYGQCSELCGVNHGFMPISIHAVDIDQFLALMDEIRPKVDPVVPAEPVIEPPASGFLDLIRDAAPGVFDNHRLLDDSENAYHGQAVTVAEEGIIYASEVVADQDPVSTEEAVETTPKEDPIAVPENETVLLVPLLLLNFCLFHLCFFLFQFGEYLLCAAIS